MLKCDFLFCSFHTYLSNNITIFGMDAVFKFKNISIVLLSSLMNLVLLTQVFLQIYCMQRIATNTVNQEKKKQWFETNKRNIK